MIDEYNNIKGSNELLDFMNKYIEYGFYGINNKIYDSCNSNFQNAFNDYYILSDKNRVLKYRLGVCYDQVELERDWFSKNNYKFKTYFIWFLLPYNNNYFTHTFLIYKYNNKYYYFEHSDSNNKGIYEFNSNIDALNYVKEKHILNNKNNGNKIDSNILNSLEIREYNKPNSNISFNSYIDFILDSKIIYKNQKFIK